MIIAHLPAAKVNGLHREDLRIDQHLLWQGEIEMRQRLLGIGSQQAATGLFMLLVLSIYKEQRGSWTKNQVSTGKSCGGRASPHHRNVINHIVSSR